MRLFILAFVCGTLLLQREIELPEPRPALVGVALLLGLALIPRSRWLARAPLLLAAGAILGYGWAAWRAQWLLTEQWPLAMEGRDVVVTGVVASLPQPNQKGVRFVLEAQRW